MIQDKDSNKQIVDSDGRTKGMKAKAVPARLGWACDWQLWVAFYHQKWDRPEILTIEPLFNVLKHALEWVRFGGVGKATFG